MGAVAHAVDALRLLTALIDQRLPLYPEIASPAIKLRLPGEAGGNESRSSEPGIKTLVLQTKRESVDLKP